MYFPFERSPFNETYPWFLYKQIYKFYAQMKLSRLITYTDHIYNCCGFRLCDDDL